MVRYPRMRCSPKIFLRKELPQQSQEEKPVGGSKSSMSEVPHGCPAIYDRLGLDKTQRVGKISSELSPHWPWNLVVYALLVAALRLFAIPVILILMRAEQKSNPNGVQEGYCLTRTRLPR